MAKLMKFHKTLEKDEIENMTQLLLQCENSKQIPLQQKLGHVLNFVLSNDFENFIKVSWNKS